jgi:hypothetical protein
MSTFIGKNSVAEQASKPLTTYEAYCDPYTREDRRLMGRFRDAYEDERLRALQDPLHPPDDPNSEPLPAGNSSGTPSMHSVWDLQPDYEYIYDDNDLDSNVSLGELDVETRDEPPLDLCPEEQEESDNEGDGDEDYLDPFLPDEAPAMDTTKDALIPSYLLCIYTLVSWLHTEFHLPRVACHATLSILAIIVGILAPAAYAPLVTLKSVNRTLGLDAPIYILTVCPQCREVYPWATSADAPDTCTRCDAELYLSDHTFCGCRCIDRRPHIKYPFLSISAQLPAIMSTPGVEESMDEWRTMCRTPGQYNDIFDGRICQGLRGPDGKKFFSNLPDERESGPSGELRIGLTWGVDWYFIIFSCTILLFYKSYIHRFS